MQVLDYKYKDGKEYESEIEDDDDDYGFEGEAGEDELEEFSKLLTDEQKEELKKRGITL